MIKFLDVEDLAQILNLEDDIFETLFPCEIGEWVQFLIQNVNDSRGFCMGGFDKNGKLIGYLVAVDSVNKPLCDEVNVIYSKTCGISKNRKILEELKKWARSRCAGSISFITENVKGHQVYGFKKKATVMSMEL